MVEYTGGGLESGVKSILEITVKEYSVSLVSVRTFVRRVERCRKPVSRQVCEIVLFRRVESPCPCSVGES